jgi:hypothetical protein
MEQKQQKVTKVPGDELQEMKGRGGGQGWKKTFFVASSH